VSDYFVFVDVFCHSTSNAYKQGFHRTWQQPSKLFVVMVLKTTALIHILLFGYPKLSFKPTIVIFSALSRFLKNSRRFKSLFNNVDPSAFLCILLYNLPYRLVTGHYFLSFAAIFFVRLLPFIYARL